MAHTTRPRDQEGSSSSSASSSDSSTECSQSDDRASLEKEAFAKPGQYGHGKNGIWLTAGIIVADVVGAGILAMPAAVAQFGWLLGAAVIVGMLAMNVHVSILLWRVKMMFPSARGYTSLVAVAFAGAPAWQQKLVTRATWFSQQAFLFSCMALYMLSAAKGVGMVNYDRYLCLPIWCLFSVATILPFCLTGRELGTWPSLVWMNVLTLLGTILIPLGYMLVNGAGEIRPRGSTVYAVAPLSAAGIFKGLSTFAFAFTSQFMLVEIIDEMKNPGELPKAYINLSAPFQGAAFLITGIVGYCYLGDKAEGMISDDLPFGPSFRVCASCLVVHMIISYIIKNVVFSKAVHHGCDEKHADEDSPRSWRLWSVIVLSVAAAAYIISNVVPFFVDAVDLVGALFAPLSCLIIPALAYLRACLDAGGGGRSIGLVEAVVISAELCLATAITFYGTFEALRTIVQSWEAYGYPFECHCHGLWNTCECSASHLGMEHCVASM